MSKFKNPNKRTAADKDAQRKGGEGRLRGTAKERGRERNRARAAKKRAEQPIQES